MQTKGSYRVEKRRQLKKSRANEECLRTTEEGGGKEILICLNSPGLIWDTIRGTGKLCRTEGGKVRRRDG